MNAFDITSDAFLDVPLFQLDSFECLLLAPGIAESDQLLKTVYHEIQTHYLQGIFRDYIWQKESLRLRIGRCK